MERLLRARPVSVADYVKAHQFTDRAIQTGRNLIYVLRALYVHIKLMFYVYNFGTYWHIFMHYR